MTSHDHLSMIRMNLILFYDELQFHFYFVFVVVYIYIYILYYIILYYLLTSTKDNNDKTPIHY